MDVYKNEIGDHLGDMLVFVSAGLTTSVQYGQTIALSRKYNRNGALTPTMIEEIAALLDSTGTVVGSDENGTHSFGNLWKGGSLGEGIQLLGTRKRWNGPGGKFVGYQFDGRTSPGKNPPQRDIPEILGACPKELMPVKLGWPMTIAQSLDMLCECAFFVGCDSGIAMLAIAAGVPTYIIQYAMSVDHWKIGLPFTKCMGTPGFKQAIGMWPQIPTAHLDHVYYRRPVDDSERDKLASFHPAGANENLVFYTVRGEEYKDMLALSIASLRTRGKYLGRVTVLTPKKCAKIDAIAKEHHVDVVEIDLKCHVRMDHTFALEWLAATRYHTVMCLDADISVMNDINPMLRQCTVLTVHEEPWRTLVSAARDPIYCAYFSPDELRRIGNMKAINVGQWMAPGARIADLLAMWKSTWLSLPNSDFHGADQASFNTLVRRVRIRSTPFLPMDVANANQTPEAEWEKYVLVHFAGAEDRLAKMQRHLVAAVPAEPAHV